LGPVPWVEHTGQRCARALYSTYGSGRWFLDDIPFVAVTQTEMNRYELRRGDILFNTRNSYALVGKVAVWADEHPGFVFNNNLRRLRTVGTVLPEWVAVQMQAPGFRRRIRGSKSATTSVCAIYTGDLLKQAVAVAPCAEQSAALRKATAAISFMYSAGDLHGEIDTQLDRLNQSILAKAFRGELVPQDPSDEPASVLLERIRAEREKLAAEKKPKKKSQNKTTEARA
jgi:type I restriction enzyme S subunit